MIKKPKHKSVRKLKKECRDLLSKLVRLRDCMRTTGTKEHCHCISCGTQKPYSEMQAGHFIDARYSMTLFNLMNVNAQCSRCNIYLDGNKIWYRRALVKRYGEDAIIEMEDSSTETKKFSVPELEALKEDFNKQIKELEGL